MCACNDFFPLQITIPAQRKELDGIWMCNRLLPDTHEICEVLKTALYLVLWLVKSILLWNFYEFRDFSSQYPRRTKLGSSTPYLAMMIMFDDEDHHHHKPPYTKVSAILKKSNTTYNMHSRGLFSMPKLKQTERKQATFDELVRRYSSRVRTASSRPTNLIWKPRDSSKIALPRRLPLSCRLSRC